MESPTTPLRSFGRRRGRKLRAHAQERVGNLLPTLRFNASTPLDAPTYLEIGFGGGEHLAHLARNLPEILMLGCEPYVNGISGLLKTIEQESLRNIRVYTEDVRDLLPFLPGVSITRVYILYPDPWPKLRHHKRRLIQKPLLDMLARVMKPGAELRMATDWEDYATWILEQLLAHPSFTWTAERYTDWSEAWAEWIPTRYEQKARNEGRKSCYIVATKR